jgi:hypothetical protein
MPYLKPQVIAMAARRLFGCAHGESLAFFFLKAAGASTQHWVTVTSSNDAPEPLVRIAGQPDGFAELVSEHLDKFEGANKLGLPTRPGTRGSADGYSFFFPLAEEAQYLLRKHDCNRNAVYSNIVGGRKADSEVRREHVFEVAEGPTTGKNVRFQREYVWAAHQYYGPDRGVPMRVPILPLAVWMARQTEFASVPKKSELIELCEQQLNITAEERALIFTGDAPEFQVSASDFTDHFDKKKYFTSLCLPSSLTAVSRMPQPSSSHSTLSREEWIYRKSVLGLNAQGTAMKPIDRARNLVELGHRSLLFLGPPRTGKSHVALDIAAEFLGVPRSQVADDPKLCRIQFHQGWSYGDFISKLVPGSSGGVLTFNQRDGAFLSHCKSNAHGRSVFVIDELNRANVAEVFGEAFHLVESSYRGGQGIRVAGDAESPKLVVPEELLLIATANNVDRSTFMLDFALLSRFATVTFEPNMAELRQILEDRPGWDSQKAAALALRLGEVQSICQFPIGHAEFFGFGPPAAVEVWYQAKLRPLLQIHLQHRMPDLDRADDLILKWSTSCDPQS